MPEFEALKRGETWPTLHSGYVTVLGLLPTPDIMIPLPSF
jgi:hypothetical protein